MLNISNKNLLNGIDDETRHKPGDSESRKQRVAQHCIVSVSVDLSAL